MGGGVTRAVVAVVKRMHEEERVRKDKVVREILEEAYKDFSDVFHYLYDSERDSNTYGWKGIVEGRMWYTIERLIRGEELHENFHWGWFIEELEEIGRILHHELWFNIERKKVDYRKFKR